MKMKGTTSKARLFLCVVFIFTFCRITLSAKQRNRTFPTPLAEESSTQQEDLSLGVFSVDARRKGWALLHVIGFIYTFASLVFVCDEFFVPAVGVTAETFHLSDDVTGATVMAAGRSSPRVLAIIIGLFLTHGDVTLGSVVGPAVYNVALVPGVCALLARDVVSLSRWPLYRDASFFLLGFVLLIVFFLDGVVHWGESAALVSVYALYVLFMKFNTQIEHGMTIQIHNTGRRWRAIFGNKHEKEDGPAPQEDGPSPQDGLGLTGCSGADGTNENQPRENSRESKNDERRVEETSEEETPVSLKWPDTVRKQLVYVLLLPVVLPPWITLPDVRNKKYRNFFILTLVGCFLWIAVDLYLMLWWGHQVGDTLGIPGPMVALVVAGTANADLVSSVVAVRRGLGNMAVSSCGGGNILNVTVFLPVSWLLRASVRGSASVDVDGSGGVCAGALLLSVFISAIVAVASCKWRMNKVLGCVLVLLYLVFVVISVMLKYRFIICPVT